MSLQSMREKVKRWRKDPIAFVKEQFSVEPDPWQEDFLRALADPNKQRIAVKASKGPGKTACLAWSIWWFLLCCAGKDAHPKGAATSISQDNLKDTLWPELAKWRTKSRLLTIAFEWTTTRIMAKDHPETWFFSARAWSKSANSEQQADTLAGLHSDNLLFVLDESGGIPDSVMVAAEGGLATGKFTKILQAGNPTHTEGPLYRACTSESTLWEVITVNADPDNPKRTTRVSEKWAREQIEKYGVDNAWVRVNVFGEFPPSSLNTLMGPNDVEKSMSITYNQESFVHQQKRLGVDVARFGGDRTVIIPRQGLVAFQPTILRNANTVEIASRIMKIKAETKAELIIVDDTGHWGHGVIDTLKTAGINAIGVMFHGQAASKKYKNRRAEGWIKMADWIKAGGNLPKIPDLQAELTTPTYMFNGGKFQIEDKDRIKERLGRSPDIADALAITFMLPDMPAQTPENAIFYGESGYQTKYDPFRERVA